MGIQIKYKKMLKFLKKKRRIVLLAAAGIFIVAGVAAATVLRSDNSGKNKPSTSTDKPQSASTEDSGGINYGPTTKEEKTETDAHKQELAQQQNQPTPTPTPGEKKPVTPIITNANQTASGINISAFVPGITEDGGSCTLTLTKGGLKVTKTNGAFFSGTNTSCQNFTVSPNDFSESGDWQAVVSYSSATAQGTSANRQITVTKP